MTQTARQLALAALLAAACPCAALASPAPPAGFLALAAKCAPSVSAVTLAALVSQESGFSPTAIGVNVTPRVVYKPKTTEDAVDQAERLVRAGKSVDLGLGQIWSGNLQRLGVTVREVLEPCRNLALAAQLLTDAYQAARSRGLAQQSALDAALSTYNTGGPTGGLTNGYVAAVRGKAELNPVVPALVATAADDGAEPAPAAPAPSWDVFGDINPIQDVGGARSATTQNDHTKQHERTTSAAPIVLLDSTNAQ